MAWVNLKDARVVRLLSKLAKLQVEATELVAKTKINDARMRAMSTRSLHEMRQRRRREKIDEQN